MAPKLSLPDVVDRALEITVAGSFTRIGYQVRQRLDEWSPMPCDMTGRVVLITGATSGLGRQTAIELALAGAKVIAVGRNAARLKAVHDEVAERGGAATPELLTIRADLSSLAAARRVVVEALAATDRLDVLIHNAGALVHDYRTTDEGFEETYAAQVLAPQLITTGLLPLLAATPDARVIVVSSGGMYSERLDPATIEMTADDFDGVAAYARAKRGQVALVEQWARREADSGVVFHAMHPGWADTPGVAESLPVFRKVVGPLLRTPEQGADTIVWLASADEPLTSNGEFWLDRRRRSTVRLPWTATAPEVGDQLWEQVTRQLQESRRPE